MSDKKIFKNKNRSKNRGKGNNKNNRNKKFNHFVPTQEQRVDKELLQDISVLLDVKPDIDNATLKRLYHITDIQADYIRKHKQKWDIWEILEGKDV